MIALPTEILLKLNLVKAGSNCSNYQTISTLSVNRFIGARPFAHSCTQAKPPTRPIGNTSDYRSFSYQLRMFQGFKGLDEAVDGTLPKMESGNADKRWDILDCQF